MTTPTQHTALPWRLDGPYRIVRDTPGPLPRIVVETTISGECSREPVNADTANAEYIVRACNSYPDLVEALRGLLAGPNWPGAQMTARAALARAEQSPASEGKE